MWPRAVIRGAVVVAIAVLLGAVSACNGGGGAARPTPTRPAAQPSSTPTHPAAVATATLPAWSTTEFIEPEYGYRLRYPSSYTKLPQFNAPSFNKFWSSAGALGPMDLKSGEVYLIVRVKENPEAFSANQWANEHRTETGPLATVVGGRAIAVAGAPSYEITLGPNEPGHSVITYVPHGGRMYSIWMTPQSLEAMQQHRAEYDAIVASFRFAD